MKILFKILSIIGLLSFIGGLKNGEMFIAGLLMACIFGYLGWRPVVKENK